VGLRRAFHGAAAISDGWLARARRLLDDCGPTRERGWLALREASFALPGDPERARERCAEARKIGKQLGDSDVEMTALALDGLIRVSHGEIAEGMARLDEAGAAAAAGDMHDPTAIGFSYCYLIFACERVRDFDRAGQWCARLAQMSDGWNVRSLRLAGRTAESGTAARKLAEIAARAATDPLLGAARQATGHALGVAGDHAAAREAFEDAFTH
jgi:LuxR family transcriptional regulator, maltose regulon positive regulatory protein